MSRSKKAMLEDIVTMTVEMVPLMIEAKVKEGHLFTVPEAELLPAEIIKEGHDWLKAIHENEFVAVKNVKKLLPEELWNRYKNWGGFENHREVRMLREKMIPFRSALISRNRPCLFKKGVVNELIKTITKDS